MKETQHTAGRDRMARSRYAELKQMLDGRRRELQAEVQGKMRVVREEGTWGGKQSMGVTGLALTALLMAATYPERVRGLVVVK